MFSFHIFTFNDFSDSTRAEGQFKQKERRKNFNWKNLTPTQQNRHPLQLTPDPLQCVGNVESSRGQVSMRKKSNIWRGD